MASNLDYLDPKLLPLEEKVKAYLEAEEDLRKATVEARSLPTTEAAEEAAARQFEQRPATGSFHQHADEVEQRIQNMHDDLAELRREIIALLPVRDEFVKVNLGYGPSRVGAFAAAGQPDSGYELRIVH
ncbi:hypothetical protein SAMN02745146_1682 [Hymenobacter daecheongensis DSM 21074]|uniref:Uncharacterized protein n=1 Tax=Hymenobacter daecheongensis DSM 21074 TaxID=1121955 RepID=A0A1M6EGR7_9BACT|nr:hypothetical protein [Hymenobacter daecheongensis]SHI84520.1 hypothetical protein SAMN02745146_1682 [Hymenobacter daecheongensis DSM 21074]